MRGRWGAVQAGQKAKEKPADARSAGFCHSLARAGLGTGRRRRRGRGSGRGSTRASHVASSSGWLHFRVLVGCLLVGGCGGLCVSASKQRRPAH